MFEIKETQFTKNWVKKQIHLAPSTWWNVEETTVKLHYHAEQSQNVFLISERKNIELVLAHRYISYRNQ